MHLTLIPKIVVKIGGRLSDDAPTRHRLARMLVHANEKVVLVHGGGCVVTDMQKALGQTPSFVAGLRVTDQEQMHVVEMALSGSINKTLVRDLLQAGCRAVGLSGVDGHLVRCRLLPGLGQVGAPESVDSQVLQLLLQGGFTPVLSPVSTGPDGAAVNVNADSFACAVAQALKAEQLYLLSDVQGVRVRGAIQPIILAHAVEALIASGEVLGGMIPKLRAAAVAVAAGVKQVRIAGFAAPVDTLEDLTGTAVVAAAEEHDA